MSNYKRNDENKNSNNSGIYAIVNLINGKRYVGQTYNLHLRWIRHKSYLKNGTSHNRHLQAAWNKYGEENFKYEIIEKCDFELLDEREIYWINYYDCLNNGYNFSKGGIGCKGYKHTEEEILKMRMVQNPEPIVQLDLDGNYLNTFISIGEAGDYIGKKSVAGISLCCKKKGYRKAYGYIWVYEKDYKSGNIDWDYYFYNSKTQKRCVLQYDMDMNFIREWESVFQTKEGGFNPSQVSIVCNGKNLSHMGYIFVFKDNPEIYFDSKVNREKENVKNKLSKQKTILQYTIDGKFIREYNQQDLIADGFSLGAVQNNCRGWSKSSGGYKWKYKEDVLFAK